MTDYEYNERGVKAIQYLQTMAGFSQSSEKAREGWVNMSKNEQDSVLVAYDIFRL